MVKSELLLLQMGDGGNIEGLYQTYVDTPGACPYNATTAKSSVANYQVLSHPYLLCPRLCAALAYSSACGWTGCLPCSRQSPAAHSLPTLADSPAIVTVA